MQSIQQDGSVMLHTRSTKYGRLCHGQAVRVPAELVKRQRQHFQSLEQAGVDIILGCNGIIWVTRHAGSPSVDSTGNAEDLSGAPPLSRGDRQKMARAAQSILALAALGLPISGQSISRVIEIASMHRVAPKHMLHAPFLSRVATAENELRQENGHELDAQ